MTEKQQFKIRNHNAQTPYVGGSPASCGKPEYACQAFVKKYGRQCEQWALKGSNYCARHLGGREKRVEFSKGIRQFVNMFYSTALGPKLTKFLETVKPDNSKELFQANQELQIARAGSLLSVTLFSSIERLLAEGINKKTGQPLTPDEKQALLLQGMAVGNQVISSMKKISEIAETAQKIHAATVSSIDVTDVDALVKQLIRILYKVCGDTHEHIAREFEEEVEKSIRLPNSVEKVQGTLISPDKAMEMMAASVVAKEPLRIEGNNAE